MTETHFSESGSSPPRTRPDFALMFPTNKPRIVPPATRPTKRTHVGSPMRVFTHAQHEQAKRLRHALLKKPKAVSALTPKGRV